MKCRVVEPLEFAGRRFVPGDVFDFPAGYVEQFLEVGQVAPLQTRYTNGLAGINFGSKGDGNE